MMKELKAMKFFFSLLLLVGVLHFVFHFFVLQQGIFGLMPSGISSYELLDNTLLENLKTKFNPVSGSSSALVLIIEWSAIFFFIVFFAFFRRIRDRKEMESLNLGKEKMEKTWTNTDLDNLYEVLKERKSLKLSTISKVYSVDKDTVMSWGRALESAGLVKVVYPMFGEPCFLFIEKR